MAVPNKSQQINRIADMLETWIDEDLPTEDAAKRIVEGMYDMWGKDITSPRMPIITGQPFKLPWASTIFRVTWEGDAEFKKDGTLSKMVWVTSATTNFGTLARSDSDVWRLATPSTSKAEPAPNKLGIQAGDVLSSGQRRYVYDVLATHEKCVLLRLRGTYALDAEQNSNIEKYFTIESKGK